MRPLPNAVRLSALVLAASASGYLWRAAFEPSATQTIIRLAPLTNGDIRDRPVVVAAPARHRRVRRVVVRASHVELASRAVRPAASPTTKRSAPSSPPQRPRPKPRPKPKPSPKPKPEPAPAPAPAPEPITPPASASASTSTPPPSSAPETGGGGSRPGNGKGDDNHDHSGPPGHGDHGHGGDEGD